MIVRYAYKDNPVDGQKIPHACVVFIDEIHFGVSVCAKNDTFNKARGRQIAEARALTSIAGTERVMQNMKGRVVVNGYLVSRQLAVTEVCLQAKEAAASYFFNPQPKLATTE
jgi:hypothetical protein